MSFCEAGCPLPSSDRTTAPVVVPDAAPARAHASRELIMDYALHFRIPRWQPSLTEYLANLLTGKCLMLHAPGVALKFMLAMTAGTSVSTTVGEMGLPGKSYSDNSTTTLHVLQWLCRFNIFTGPP